MISQRYIDDDIPVPLHLADVWGTVEDMFRLIEDAIDRDAESVQVTYHDRLGYPTHISIDYSSRIADDELVVTAADLVLQNIAADSP